MILGHIHPCRGTLTASRLPSRPAWRCAADRLPSCVAHGIPDMPDVVAPIGCVCVVPMNGCLIGGVAPLNASIPYAKYCPYAVLSIFLNDIIEIILLARILYEICFNRTIILQIHTLCIFTCAALQLRNPPDLAWPSCFTDLRMPCNFPNFSA